MVSTPSRSRAAIRISLPFMRGPTSGRSCVDFVCAASVCVLIARCLSLVPPGGRGQIKNPRPFPAVGSCQKFLLISTSANGVCNYYSYDAIQDYLSNNCGHWDHL